MYSVQSDNGDYICAPAAGMHATVSVHVLQRDTEVQAVLGEGGKLMHARVSVHVLQRVYKAQTVLGGNFMHARVSVHVLQRDTEVQAL